MQNTTRLGNIRPPKKRSLFSSAPSSNFYPKRKKSHAPCQILSLANGIFAHFCHFSFFSDENQDIYFSISKRKKKKGGKSLALVIFLFFSDENQDIFFFVALVLLRWQKVVMQCTKLGIRSQFPHFRAFKINIEELIMWYIFQCHFSVEF